MGRGPWLPPLEGERCPPGRTTLQLQDLRPPGPERDCRSLVASGAAGRLHGQTRLPTAVLPLVMPKPLTPAQSPLRLASLAGPAPGAQEPSDLGQPPHSLGLTGHSARLALSDPRTLAAIHSAAKVPGQKGAESSPGRGWTGERGEAGRVQNRGMGVGAGMGSSRRAPASPET